MPHVRIRLFAASAALLFAELAVVRWTGSELHHLAFFNNLVVIGAFLGGGIGIALGPRRPRLAGLVGLLAVLAVAVPWVSRSSWVLALRFGSTGEYRWNLGVADAGAAAGFLLFFVVLFVLTVALFLGFGALVGQLLARVPGLGGYALNLLGSLVGVLGFAAVSLAGLGPAGWLLLLAAPLVLGLGRGRPALVGGALAVLSGATVAALSEEAT